jgi:hypothetical protein
VDIAVLFRGVPSHACEQENGTSDGFWKLGPRRDDLSKARISCCSRCCSGRCRSVENA